VRKEEQTAKWKIVRESAQAVIGLWKGSNQATAASIVGLSLVADAALGLFMGMGA
jgi:hypothetical protein